MSGAVEYLFYECMHTRMCGAEGGYDVQDKINARLQTPCADAIDGYYPEAALIPASRAVSLFRAVSYFFGWGAAPASPNVVFGTGVEGELHATRWLVDKGIEVGPVKNAIRQDLTTKGAAARPAGGNGWSGSVNVGGQNIGYSAYRLPDGTINVGSIRPPR